MTVTQVPFFLSSASGRRPNSGGTKFSAAVTPPRGGCRNDWGLRALSSLPSAVQGRKALGPESFVCYQYHVHRGSLSALVCVVLNRSTPVRGEAHRHSSCMAAVSSRSNGSLDLS